MRTVQSWDIGFTLGTVKNGTKQAAPPVWQVYNHEIIPLMDGDTLYVNAMRIGYKPAVIKYSNGKTEIEKSVSP
jgi:hypothetical protein